MKLRQAMAIAARAQLARMEAKEAQLERAGNVADLARLQSEIGYLEVGIELLSPHEKESSPAPSTPPARP